MRTESGLYYGSLEGEVGSFLMQWFHELPSFLSAIIRCIDSTREPSGILSILQRHGVKARLEVPVVLLSPHEVERAAEGGVFTSFDEVWLLEGDVPKHDFHLQHYLGSGFDGSFNVPPVVEVYMKQLGCVVALQADIRLNYVTWDGKFATLIEAAQN